MSGVYFNPECLHDRVRFTYAVKNCDGVPDRDGMIEIMYSDFQNLPLLPEGVENRKAGMSDYSVQRYHIPNINADVAFIIQSWRERVYGNEYDFQGPYRARLESPIG